MLAKKVILMHQHISIFPLYIEGGDSPRGGGIEILDPNPYKAILHLQAQSSLYISLSQIHPKKRPVQVYWTTGHLANS